MTFDEACAVHADYRPAGVLYHWRYEDLCGLPTGPPWKQIGAVSDGPASPIHPNVQAIIYSVTHDPASALAMFMRGYGEARRG